MDDVENGVATGSPAPPLNPNPRPHSNFNLMTLLTRKELTGPNYLDWIRTLRIALRFEDLEYVLDNKLPDLTDKSTPKEKADYLQHDKDSNKVACLMLATMS